MPLSKVLDVDQGAREHYHVPKYQRPYSWGKPEWEQLLLDIDENEPGYFMGSLICVRDTWDQGPGDEHVYELIDGQQRLTTISLLLAAIHTNLAAALRNYTFADDDEEDDTRSIQSSIKHKLFKRKPDARPGEPGGFFVGTTWHFLRVQPSSQGSNLVDYRYVLCQAGLLAGQQKPKYVGLRALSKAFQYFRTHIPSGVRELRDLTRKINQLTFVQITVNSQADAFTLFETLNNRGVPLTAIDIIKNKMLAQLEQKHDLQVEESFERWQTVVDSVPESGDQERFLRHFYNAFKNIADVRVERIPRATKSQIIRIYEALIRRDALKLLGRLEAAAQVYGPMSRPSPDRMDPVSGPLIELQRIGAAPAYQLLLFLFSLPRDAFQEDDFLPRAVDILCRYYLRRNVTDIPGTRHLDPANIEVIEACQRLVDAGEPITIEEFARLLLGGRGKPATLTQFRDALRGGLYEESGSTTRYLLVRLDELHHTREYKPDLWARDEKGRFVWTVEHVLPQTDDLPAAWVATIAEGDAKKAGEIQEELAHCLGNLTLSGYNSSLAVASFSKKQELSQRTTLGHSISIGYRNGLALNALSYAFDGRRESLATAPTWSAERIRSRTDVMVDLILRANLLPGESLPES